MKKTISIIAMATLCLFLSVQAQIQVTKPTYKPVKIGDRIPDVTLTNIYNYKTTKTNLSDFKAKLIILDFWATWCTSCLVNFPKIEKLQKNYGGEVQFIKVAYQPKEEVLPFLEKFYKGKPSVIPVVTNDIILDQLFPHIYLPHYVWLDQAGNVVATTTSDQITIENIDRFLSSDSIGDMRLKVDLDDAEPLFINNELLKNNELKHYSVFLKGLYDGLGSGVNEQFNKAGKLTGLNITNMALLSMYEQVASGLFKQRGKTYSKTRSLILVKDPALIAHKSGAGPNGFYTYAGNAPELKDTLVYQHVFDELNRYSDYRGSIEKIKVKCLVLRRTSKVDKMKTKGGTPKSQRFTDPDAKLINYPLTILLLRISELPFINMPLIDETGYKEPVDIQVLKRDDLTALRQSLKAYDLELIAGIRELDMFVLRDKD
ncbi:TlpA family protein disulfide reductase [Pedobacter sp. WC2423]|uniref:TlpA family protein disulfide reductase n=1 Tax=Pedobacter sp. WC2423 TaxID=3234142 RepID=UPI003466AFFE